MNSFLKHSGQSYALTYRIVIKTADGVLESCNRGMADWITEPWNCSQPSVYGNSPFKI